MRSYCIRSSLPAKFPPFSSSSSSSGVWWYGRLLLGASSQGSSWLTALCRRSLSSSISLSLLATAAFNSVSCACVVLSRWIASCFPFQALFLENALLSASWKLYHGGNPSIAFDVGIFQRRGRNSWGFSPASLDSRNWPISHSSILLHWSLHPLRRSNHQRWYLLSIRLKVFRRKNY